MSPSQGLSRRGRRGNTEVAEELLARVPRAEGAQFPLRVHRETSAPSAAQALFWTYHASLIPGTGYAPQRHEEHGEKKQWIFLRDLCASVVILFFYRNTRQFQLGGPHLPSPSASAGECNCPPKL